MEKQSGQQTSTNVELPGLSIEALKLQPELWKRVVERAAEDHISDQEALRRITNEDLKDAASDRARDHAP